MEVASSRIAELSRPKPASLQRNFAWMLLGNVVFAASQWGTLAVLAKIGSAAMVGEFALALAITSPVFLLTNLGLRSIETTDVEKKYRFNDYVSLRAAMILVALIAVLVISVATADHLWVVATCMMMAAAKAADAVSDIIYGFLQVQDRMERISVSRALQGLIQIVCLAIVVYWTKSIVWGVAAMAFASAFTTVAYDISSITHTSKGKRFSTPSLFARAFHLDWSFATSKKLFLLSLPLGIVAFFVVVVVNVPRYLVNHFDGKAALGYYAAISYLMIAGGTIITALAEAARPRLARYFLEDREQFIKLMAKLSVLSLGLGGSGIVVALFFGRTLLGRLYRAEYALHADLLVWVMIASLFWYLSTILSTSIVASRSFRLLSPLLVFTLINTSIACMWFVPQHGLVGAGWALCVGMGSRLAGSLWIMLAILRKQAAQRY